MSDASRSLLAGALAVVPTHRQAHQTAQAMSEALVQATPGLGSNEARVAVQVALEMLGAFGVLHWQDDCARASDQLSTYLIRSLMWYSQHGVAFVDDSADGKRELLHQMELRRVRLSQTMGIAAEPAREQEASLVLFQKNLRGKPCLLFQWDERAQQYQLIGGRVEPGETPHETAIREACEEVGDIQPTPWQHGVDFTVVPLPLKHGFIELTAISPTYGALTRYHFYFFRATVAAMGMTLGQMDRWIPIEHIQNRQGKLTLGDGDLYLALDAALDGGLMSLASSFAVTSGGASGARHRPAHR